MELDMRLESCIGTIEKWLKSCSEHHKGCERREMSRLPTKLLDVGVYTRWRLRSKALHLIARPNRFLDKPSLDLGHYGDSLARY